MGDYKLIYIKVKQSLERSIYRLVLELLVGGKGEETDPLTGSLDRIQPCWHLDATTLISNF